MTNRLAGQCGGAPYKYFGEWTDRIAKGELPKTEPPRPQGVERNVVITSWEWSTPDKYLHDLISSDRRNPTVNAYGPLYGSPEYSTDNMPILDPKTNKVSFFKMPVRDAEHAGIAWARSCRHRQADCSLRPTGATRQLWDTRANNHNSMFDKQGARLAHGERARHGQSGLLQEGLGPSVRQGLPARKVAAPGGDARSQDDEVHLRRHLLCAPITRSSAMTPTIRCGSAAPARWRAGSTPRCFDETGDAEKAQGWAPWVLDTNGNGKLDDYVEPTAPADPAKDRRITAGSGPYSVMPNPKDGSIWYAIGTFAGPPGFLRFDPKTKLSEVYYIPKPGFGIRGGDIDSDGVSVGIGLERSPDELRPAQVQGAAQRTEGNRQPLSGRLGLLQISRPRL